LIEYEERPKRVEDVKQVPCLPATEVMVVDQVENPPSKDKNSSPSKKSSKEKHEAGCKGKEK
jgi:hypothetical protein